MVELTGALDFELASKRVLAFLHQRLGFDLWMVTRTEGDDWIILHTEREGYDLVPGSILRWADSFCSQMVQGNGPSFATNVNLIPAYANVEIRRQIQIGAYVGLPMKRNDGSLFGTLCALHPTTLPESLQAELPLVELLNQLLSSILNSELNSAEQHRRAERALCDATTDALTSLYNRRGWDELCAAEESRCRRTGNPVCAISIDLDGLKYLNDTCGHSAGDDLLRRAAKAIRSAIRDHDIAARIGGDEFAVLGIECNLEQSKFLVERISTVFSEQEIHASIGFAQRHPNSGLIRALEEADNAMYEIKRSKRISRGNS